MPSFALAVLGHDLRFRQDLRSEISQQARNRVCCVRRRIVLYAFLEALDGRAWVTSHVPELFQAVRDANSARLLQNR
jgi:hypothetical protein